jgi:hypothetical protein
MRNVSIFIMFISMIIGCNQSNGVNPKEAASDILIPDAAQITIVVVDSSTVGERIRVDVENPAMRPRFVDAINKLDLSGDGVPMSVAGDMPASEINLTIVDEATTAFHISLYWGDSDGGSVIYGNTCYQVQTGLSAIRELVSESTELTRFGRRDREVQITN